VIIHKGKQYTLAQFERLLPSQLAGSSAFPRYSRMTPAELAAEDALFRARDVSHFEPKNEDSK
jgi:hypothetical protein